MASVISPARDYTNSRDWAKRNSRGRKVPERSATNGRLGNLKGYARIASRYVRVGSNAAKKSRKVTRARYLHFPRNPARVTKLQTAVSLTIQSSK